MQNCHSQRALRKVEDVLLAIGCRHHVVPTASTMCQPTNFHCLVASYSKSSDLLDIIGRGANRVDGAHVHLVAPSVGIQLTTRQLAGLDAFEPLEQLDEVQLVARAVGRHAQLLNAGRLAQVLLDAAHARSAREAVHTSRRRRGHRALALALDIRERPPVGARDLLGREVAAAVAHGRKVHAVFLFIVARYSRAVVRARAVVEVAVLHGHTTYRGSIIHEQINTETVLKCCAQSGN